MIEYSPDAWAQFLMLLALACGAGLSLARFVPWSEHAFRAGIPRAFGLAVAPFVAGSAIVAVMLLLPGASARAHLYATGAVLALICLLGALGLRRGASDSRDVDTNDGPQAGALLLGSLLGLWALALLANTLFIPLLQNDALEYALVGRELFNARSLAVYPLLNPESNLTGFFGPWTHPPLYVSLIYLASALQGHADAPGLMRVIAPWFLLSATFGVVALGRLWSTRVGLLAGIFMISTPLLFLGADSALIDALPVSALVLLALLIAGCASTGRPLRSLWIGVALGLALWTHSQAILYIGLFGAVLALENGWAGRGRVAATLAIVFGVAGVLAGWPYLRNWEIFGSPISDNPLIFAMPELDWEGYFRFARGLDHDLAILQYGVMKGWFSLEAYGYLFWLGTLGFVLSWSRALRTHGRELLVSGTSGVSPPDKCLLLCAVLVTLYLAGVCLSVLLGIDLMIRNERYMLVIVPALALLAAFGAERLIVGGARCLGNRASRLLTKDSILLGAWFVLLVLLVQFVLIGIVFRWRNLPPAQKPRVAIESRSAAPVVAVERFERILDHWPSIRTVRQMASRLPREALVLTMRPADMYYAHRRMVSYLDPRLQPFYRESSPDVAAAMLRAQGVTHVHAVEYGLPPLYDSTLERILADPRLSALEYSYGGHQVFSLRDSGLREVASRVITPGEFAWSRSPQVRIGGRKALLGLGLSPVVLEGQVSESAFGLFHRDYSVLLESDLVDVDAADVTPNQGATAAAGEHFVRLELAGKGFIRVWLEEFDADGLVIRRDTSEDVGPIRIGEFSLSEQKPRRVLSRRLALLARTRFIRLSVEHVGRSRVSIERASVSRLEVVAPAALR